MAKDVDYKLNITKNNELVPVNIDLVEIFNYLIGLHVNRVERIGAFKIVEGVTNSSDKVLVIWRNLEESNNDDFIVFKSNHTPLVLITLPGNNLKPQWIQNRTSTEAKAMQE